MQVPVKTFVGIDIFVDWDPAGARRDPARLAAVLTGAAGDEFKLSMVRCRV